MKPCMGGWCRQRERCAHYHAISALEPAERLCGPEEEPELMLKDQIASEGDFRRWAAGMLSTPYPTQTNATTARGTAVKHT